MSVYPCPQGHDSIDADYCSQCGTKIIILASPVIPAVVECPSCQAPHPGGDFCEACGYNFITGKSAVDLPPVASWILEIGVDPIKAPESQQQGSTTQAMNLSSGSYLIGRTSQARAIYPQIPLETDDAISHRHAIIEIKDDHSALLRDIGSANGTSLNGHEIPIVRDVPLQSQDVITLGHWTKLTIIKQ
jgi:pSer/pThr/pTyr-binding forkhead associated (FHA) protein